MSNPYGRTPKPSKRSVAGQEPRAPEHTVASLALWAAVDELALKLEVNQDDLAHTVTRALFAAANAGDLSREVAELIRRMPPELRASHFAAFDELARMWLERPKEKKRRGRGAAEEIADLAATSRVAVDFPTPGPDEGRAP